jgi:AcrR family transcriptional regulator
LTPPTPPLEGPALFAHPLAGAVVAVVAERGYADASVEDFIRRAGVEREEFDRLFADKGDAVLRVFEAYADDFERTVGRSFESSPTWPDNLRAAAYASLRWMRDYPEGIRFGMVGVLEAGEMVRVRREDVFRWCAGLIDKGRELAPDPDAVPAGAALMAIGAAVELLTRQIQGTVEADPSEMVQRLMYGAVRPYLGEQAARRELEILPPLHLPLAPG